MSREEILWTIRMLASEKGLYSGMYRWLQGLSEEEREEWLSKLEEQKFTDVVDMVLFFEC